MDQRTRAAQLPVDTLSTRALSLCRLPFFCGSYLTSRSKSNLHFDGLALLAWLCPFRQERAAERLGVWTYPGVYLVFLSSCFLIGFRCEYPIEALNK